MIALTLSSFAIGLALALGIAGRRSLEDIRAHLDSELRIIQGKLTRLDDRISHLPAQSSTGAPQAPPVAPTPEG